MCKVGDDNGEYSNSSDQRNKRCQCITIRASQKYQRLEKVGMRQKWIFQMKSQMRDGCYQAEKRERGEAQRDSSPPGFKVIQPSHPTRA